MTRASMGDSARRAARLLIAAVTIAMTGGAGAPVAVARDGPPLDLTREPEALLPPEPWVRPGGQPPGETRRNFTSDDVALEQGSGARPESTGGPDVYGYTWTDAVAYNWIDASGGADTGVTVTTPSSGWIDLGFNFKFYEYTYSGLYVSLHGYASFDYNSTGRSQSPIPSSDWPNNVIAPHWTPIGRLNGYVRYLRGGAAPNRFFVVEWNRIVSTWDGDDEYTAEMVLYENGTIDFSYKTMAPSGNWWCQSSGIEDARGADGFATSPWCTQIAGNHTVRISRPIPNARLRPVKPAVGGLGHPGSAITIAFGIRNLGELGPDVIDLTPTSPWPIAIVDASTSLPMVDTDLDGIPDTGLLAQLGTANLAAVLNVPAGAVVGDAMTATIVARSSVNSGISATLRVQVAVPSAFGQVFQEADGGMRLLLEKPGSEREARASYARRYGYNPAVTERPDGGFAYTWSKGACLDTTCSRTTWDIEYALLDSRGDIQRSLSKLTDNSLAPINIWDDFPAVTAAPNGRLGLIWRREAHQQISGVSYYQDNSFLAIMDAFGERVYGPVNLTNYGGWGRFPDIPFIDDPRISATADNRFVVAWKVSSGVPNCATSDCSLNDIYLAVIGPQGSVVLPPTRLTTDTTGSTYEGYYDPNLAPIDANRTLLTWYRVSDGAAYYSVIDNSGNMVRNPTSIVSGATFSWGNRPDAAQLSDGNTLLAWDDYGKIWFAVLDAAYNRVAGPTALPNPSNPGMDAYVSVAADTSGRAVLTWRSTTSSDQLYYALVDGLGRILTHPMPYRQSGYLHTGYDGHANTAYRANVALIPPFERAFLAFAPTPCDAFEGNDSRWQLAGGMIQTGVTHSARFCQGDAEDNYRFTTSVAGPITISLSLPNSLFQHVVYFVYPASNLSTPLNTCLLAGTYINSAPFATTCAGLSPGDYVLRLYTGPSEGGVYHDEAHPYTFRVTE